MCVYMNEGDVCIGRNDTNINRFEWLCVMMYDDPETHQDCLYCIYVMYGIFMCNVG